MHSYKYYRLRSVESIRVPYSLELVTVLCSNLRDLVTPNLILQLNALKEHMGVDSFLHVNKVCESSANLNLFSWDENQ